MYEEIFNQIRSAANKRNLKDSTIHAYCTSVAHFLNHTAKDIAALTNDDISLTNKTIHIRDGKSRSDRYTLLADRTLEILTEYWFQCGRSRGILFPSSWTGDYLTKDSVIQFFRESAKRAGIQQHVSTHCFFLRREYGITPQR